MPQAGGLLGIAQDLDRQGAEARPARWRHGQSGAERWNRMSAYAVTLDPLLTRKDWGGMVTLTLNRPAQFNALSEDLLAALQDELDALATDESVRCVVLAGAGKAFCAGHDLKEMQAHDEERYFRDLFTRCSRVMQAIRALPVPVIAPVHASAT